MAFSQSIFAGVADAGYEDGDHLVARFSNPNGIVVLQDGSVVVADTGNHCIRLIAPDNGTGRLSVSTLAGRAGQPGFVNGSIVEARLWNPHSVVVSSEGNIVCVDNSNCIRSIEGYDVYTLAGSREGGEADGIGTAATFNLPSGLAFGPGDVLYVTDFGSDRVRMISPDDNAVTTLAGGRGFAEGRGADARFNGPYGIAVNAAGVVFVADQDNHRIRRITNGVVDTLAGSGEAGLADGVGAAAQFRKLAGLALDPTTGNLLVIDRKRIRSVDPRTGAVTTLTTVNMSSSPKNIAVDRYGIILLTVGNQIIRLSRVIAGLAGGRRSASRYKSKRSKRSRRSRRSRRSMHSKRTIKLI